MHALNRLSGGNCDYGGRLYLRQALDDIQKASQAKAGRDQPHHQQAGLPLQIGFFRQVRALRFQRGDAQVVLMHFLDKGAADGYSLLNPIGSFSS